MLAQRVGRSVSDEQMDEMVYRMESLPPHPEVPGALARLRETPLKVVALVNSPRVVGEAQLTNAGIRDNFHDVISADTVRHLKPSREPHRSVADEFGLDVSDIRLVAAHSWDISGALAAGCPAAFVSRPGMVLSPLGDQPDIVERNIAGSSTGFLPRTSDSPRSQAAHKYKRDGEMDTEQTASLGSARAERAGGPPSGGRRRRAPEVRPATAG